VIEGRRGAAKSAKQAAAAALSVSALSSIDLLVAVSGFGHVRGRLHTRQLDAESKVWERHQMIQIYSILHFPVSTYQYHSQGFNWTWLIIVHQLPSHFRQKP
jgi:hypothetical protein